MTAPKTLATAYREIFVAQDAHGRDVFGWRCNLCFRPVGPLPCDIHAPREVAGLTRFECSKGLHGPWWQLPSDADGYGSACWRCETEERTEQLVALKTRAGATS